VNPRSTAPISNVGRAKTSRRGRLVEGRRGIWSRSAPTARAVGPGQISLSTCLAIAAWPLVSRGRGGEAALPTGANGV